MGTDMESHNLMSEEMVVPINIVPAKTCSLPRLSVAGLGLCFSGVLAVGLFKQRKVTSTSALDLLTYDETTSCSKAGDGCLDTKCCSDPTLTCFKQDDGWADCKAACAAGKVDPNSPEEFQTVWSCDVLSVQVDGTTGSTGPPPSAQPPSAQPPSAQPTTQQPTTQPTELPPNACKCTTDGPDGAWKVGTVGANAWCKEGKQGCCEPSEGRMCDGDSTESGAEAESADKPAQTIPSKIMCDLNAKIPQLCPGQTECPKCGAKDGQCSCPDN